MGWQIVLLLLFGFLILLFFTGLPVSASFIVIATVAIFILWGGIKGLNEIGLQIYSSLTSISLMPLPPFILMGEIMFRAGTTTGIMEAVEHWMGRVPGRLALLSVIAGTVFGTFTGSSTASCAVLGKALVPEMENRGYKKAMSIGPILGSGGLAIMIPPSGMAILIAAIGEMSVGRLLMAIIVPGLVTATLYAIYIIGRCALQPSLAPAYSTSDVPLSTKLRETLIHLVPLTIVIFFVIGLIFLGIATPTEAAAAGVIGTIIVVAIHRQLNWKVIWEASKDSMHLTAMLFLIIAMAQTYSQILAFSGAGKGLVEYTTGLALSPMVTMLAILLVVFTLGMFMPTGAVIMVALPLFIPIVDALGFDRVWFGVLFMVEMELAVISPPYGINLLVMRGVSPSGTTMKDIFLASIPYVVLDIITLLIILYVPQTALWLPGMLK